jgi:hypothetical protein
MKVMKSKPWMSVDVCPARQGFTEGTQLRTTLT